MSATDDLERERVAADVVLSATANKIILLRDDLPRLKLLRVKLDGVLNDMTYLDAQQKTGGDT